jgi:cytochrome c peroxidase
VNFTDELYRNIGIGLSGDNPAPAAMRLRTSPRTGERLKTPTIRGTMYTAHDMQDGSLATLEDVIEWYADEGRANRNRDYHHPTIEGK